MAVRLHGAGHDVVVYNRSGGPPGLASLLTAAASPAVAAAGAELIISMVSDDAASCAVWLGAERAAAALRPGAVAIESSTLSPSWVTTLGMKIRETGAEFLDDPVLGSLPQAEAGALIYLIGGPVEVSERVRPVLSALGGTLHHRHTGELRGELDPTTKPAQAEHTAAAAGAVGKIAPAPRMQRRIALAAGTARIDGVGGTKHSIDMAARLAAAGANRAGGALGSRGYITPCRHRLGRLTVLAGV